MRREQKSKTKIYVGYLTEIINYHLHFDFTVSHPSFFCPCVTDVDVRAVLGVRSVDPVTTLEVITLVWVRASLDLVTRAPSCVTHISDAPPWPELEKTVIMRSHQSASVSSPVAAVWCSHCLYQDQAIIIIIINSALPTFSPKIEWI